MYGMVWHMIYWWRLGFETTLCLKLPFCAIIFGDILTNITLGLQYIWNNSTKPLNNLSKDEQRRILLGGDGRYFREAAKTKKKTWWRQLIHSGGTECTQQRVQKFQKNYDITIRKIKYCYTVCTAIDAVLYIFVSSVLSLPVILLLLKNLDTTNDHHDYMKWLLYLQNKEN